jgi:nitrogen fixation/metabolism regulation signal transduction histidine kinase
MENAFMNTVFSIAGIFLIVMIFSFLADFKSKRPLQKRVLYSAVISLVIVIILKML